MVPVDVSGLETIDAIMKRVRAVLSLLTGTPSDDPEIANVPLGEVEEILGTMGGRRLHQEDLVEVMLRGRCDQIRTQKNWNEPGGAC